MTRKWADQQEYVTRWKYVGAVPTFPQIRPTIIIESWICIWSWLTTPSFKTFVFCFSLSFSFCISLAIHYWWKTSRFEQNCVCVFHWPQNFHFHTHWMSISQHIACFLHVVLFALFWNLSHIKQTVVLVLLVFALARLEIQFGISC